MLSIKWLAEISTDLVEYSVSLYCLFSNELLLPLWSMF